ncbi:G-protein coupled receptor 157-like [Mercenaria mercenaria]|uniref:G-protein coupled receptor 157-like n=1 Tax=Mercenaria mercenaria TaxID=6596 RepID=UPI00234F5207|nr:G-protein coupled receptor 157-like [Mercenaria mercenaria]
MGDINVIVNQTANQTFALHMYHAIISGTSSGLSILGAIIIFVTYFTIKEIQNFTRQLLLYLTMADILTAVGHLIAVGRYVSENFCENSTSKAVYCGVNDNATYDILSVCVIQSFLTTYSNLVSFFWIAMIAVHLWSSVVLKTWRTEMLQTQVVYHVICWIVPFSIVYALLIESKLGEDYCYGTGIWCGIRAVSQGEKQWLQYVTDVAWQITCYLIVSVLYIHLKFYLKLYYHGQRLAMVAGRLRNEDENFLFIWIVIYLLKLWGLTRFFIMTYLPPDKLYNSQTMKTFLEFLLIMQSYGAGGQGFWNCVFFCFLDKTVWKNMMLYITRDNSEERENILSNNSTRENRDISERI